MIRLNADLNLTAQVSVALPSADPAVADRIIAALQASAPGAGDASHETVSGGPATEPDVLIVVVDGEGACSEVTSAGHIVAVVAEGSRPLRTAADLPATGIVPLANIESALAPTIAAVVAGQVVVPPYAWGPARRPTLSTREKQVLAMVVLGFSNAEIAQKLAVAETTVKSHLSSSFAKLGVASRGEAVEAILDPQRGLGTGILSISEAESPVAGIPQ